MPIANDATKSLHTPIASSLSCSSRPRRRGGALAGRLCVNRLTFCFLQMGSTRLGCVPVDIELVQDRAQSVPRRRLQLIEQAVALAVDGDHERPQILDPQLDQPIV